MSLNLFDALEFTCFFFFYFTFAYSFFPHSSFRALPVSVWNWVLIAGEKWSGAVHGFLPGRGGWEVCGVFPEVSDQWPPHTRFFYIYIRFINIGRLYGGCSIYFKKFNLSEIKLFSCFQCQIPQGNARHAKVLPFLHSGIQDHLSGKEVWSSNIGQQVTKTIHKFTFNSAFSLMLPQCYVMIIILLRLPASYPNRHSVFFVLFKSLTVNFDEFKNKRAELHFTGTITDEWCVCIQMKKGLLSEEPDRYPLLLWSYACSHNETAFFLKSIRVFQAVSIANHFMHFPPGFNSSYPFIQDEHRSGEVEGGIRVGRSAQQRAGGEREGAAGR